MRLHRLNYSPFARYVQAAIELAKAPCEIVDVEYGNREALARLTSGYILVPVLERDDGSVLTDSRVIMATLIREDARFASLVPDADAGPIWAYADWANVVLLDVAFRLASPGIAVRFRTEFEKALFVFAKERKFGGGCVQAWADDADGWFARLQAALEPSVQTLQLRPFLFGETPCLADCALYGQLAMMDLGCADRVAALPAPLHAWRTRFEARVGPPPYGRGAAAHYGRAVLDARLVERSGAARSGKLELIVQRPSMHERVLPAEAELLVDGGLADDSWGKTGKKLDHDVSLMDVRMAGAMAERGDWSLFGDNLFVDFDLGVGSLRTGDRFTLGEVLLELTAAPHLGCRKLAARFGREALLWVNDKGTRDERRRGAFAKVLRSGTVKVGDELRRA